MQTNTLTYTGPRKNETSLYARFLLLCKTYELVPPSLVTIPDDAQEKTTTGHNNNNDEDYNRQAVTVLRNGNDSPVDKDQWAILHRCYDPSFQVYKTT